MKIAKLSSLALLSLFVPQIVGTARAQFQNLDFEQERLPDLPAGAFGGFVPVSDALPGWSVFLGTNQQTQVYHNGLTAGTAAVGVMTPNWTSGIIDGHAMVSLQAGQDPLVSPGPVCACVAASVQASGIIPTDAKSLQLKVRPQQTRSNPFDGFSVYLNGQGLLLLQLGGGSTYALLGGDIVNHAGQSSTLTISSTSVPSWSLNGFWVDAVVFSAEPVPEPSVITLLTVAGCTSLLIAIRRRKRDPRT